MLTGRKKETERKEGTFVISLDFELFWGVHDIFDKQRYRVNILGVQQVVPALLNLFKTYRIHVTWAIVGMLYFKDEQDLRDNLPDLKPSYKNRRLSAYDYLEKNSVTNADHALLFAPDLIQQIRAIPGQEIATHSFSHYYCLEKGQTREQFSADMKQTKKINQQRGIDAKSIVFPRNQINPSYLDTCWELGFSAYRGNEKTWIYRLQINDRKHLLKRGLRLLDIYFNLFGHQTYTIQQPAAPALINIPSSRMLKPVSSKLSWLERKKLTRILDDMTYAAKRGEIYHLWWHPHNFGVNIEQNLSFLKVILAHYKRLQKSHGFKSMAMGEVASEVLQFKTEKNNNNEMSGVLK